MNSRMHHLQDRYAGIVENLVISHTAWLEKVSNKPVIKMQDPFPPISAVEKKAVIVLFNNCQENLARHVGTSLQFFFFNFTIFKKVCGNLEKKPERD